MKKLVSLIVLVTVFISCGQQKNGELVGVQGRKDWYESQPHGMVFVPMGSYTMGPSDESASWAMTSKSKTVSVDAFWMDATEITNNEYRQFVKYVKDSILRRKLGQQIEDFLITEDEFGNPIDPPRINWETEIDPTDEAQKEIINEMYYPENERLFGKKKIDTRKLIYEYYWVDYQQAAQRKNMYNHETKQYEGSVINDRGEKVDVDSRQAFIMRGRTNVYPDTLVWIRDFTYSFNEPYADNYFAHPAYDDYPVVGVDWEQAFAFSIWRTKQLNTYLRSQGEGQVQDYRMPTEAEWEYAARSGGKPQKYAGGDDVGRVAWCQGNSRYRTQEVGTKAPNDLGIYDMSGYVYEWCRDWYSDDSYSRSPKYNPKGPSSGSRRVFRGGRWDSDPRYVRPANRYREAPDYKDDDLGFRLCLPQSGE